MSRRDPLLSVEDLRVGFHADDALVRAVDGVNFEVARGETVCVVGESGAGKTVAAESLTRLNEPPAEIDGEIRFDGRDVLAMTESELEALRGGRVGHVFQDPRTSFNPVYTVGWQIAEAIRLHEDATRAEARRRAIDLLDRVDIADPAARVDDHPHEFSGGQLQRAGIAMALAATPDLLIADEPTTGLDPTVQLGVLRLLAGVREEFDAGVLLITHDLGVVAEAADRVIVVYGGKVMESGDVYDVFESPAHPYTRALFSCLPGRDGTGEGEETGGRGGIPGSPPSAANPPGGCRFHPRCPDAVDACRAGEQPPMYSTPGVDDGVDGGDRDAEHRVSCVHYGPEGDLAALSDRGGGGGDP